MTKQEARDHLRAWFAGALLTFGLFVMPYLDGMAMTEMWEYRLPVLAYILVGSWTLARGAPIFGVVLHELFLDKFFLVPFMATVALYLAVTPEWQESKHLTSLAAGGLGGILGEGMASWGRREGRRSGFESGLVSGHRGVCKECRPERPCERLRNEVGLHELFGANRPV